MCWINSSHYPEKGPSFAILNVKKTAFFVVVGNLGAFSVSIFYSIWTVQKVVYCHFLRFYGYLTPSMCHMKPIFIVWPYYPRDLGWPWLGAMSPMARTVFEVFQARYCCFMGCASTWHDYVVRRSQRWQRAYGLWHDCDFIGDHLITLWNIFGKFMLLAIKHHFRIENQPNSL